MARRRGRKGRGRKGKGAVPVLQAAIIGFPIVQGFRSGGISESGLDQAVYNLTGYSLGGGKFLDAKKPVVLAVTLLAVSTIGTKLANRTGANRIIKKATGGLLKIC